MVFEEVGKPSKQCREQPTNSVHSHQCINGLGNRIQAKAEENERFHREPSLFQSWLMPSSDFLCCKVFLKILQGILRGRALTETKKKKQPKKKKTAVAKFSLIQVLNCSAYRI